MLKKTGKRNIGLIGLSEFFSFFGITTFWILFLSENGMSLLQIGILESIFHATSFISEIPTGILADRFTYKTNIYISRIFIVIASILMLVSKGSFIIYAIAMVIRAWSYNFDSGTALAMLYESIKEAGLEDKYLKYSSIFSGIGEFTRASGMIIAGFFVHGFLNYTYMIQISLVFIALVFIFFIKEPDIKEKEEYKITFKEIITTVSKTFKEDFRLLNSMIIIQFGLVLMSMFYFYFQNELISYSSIKISMLMVISSLLNISSVYLASKVGNKINIKNTFIILLIITGFLFSLSNLNNYNVYLFIFLLTESLFSFFSTIFYNDLQQRLKSNVRATLLSVNTMFFSLSMIFIFPVVGYLIDSLGFSFSFLLIGIVMIIIGIILSNNSIKKYY